MTKKDINKNYFFSILIWFIFLLNSSNVSDISSNESRIPLNLIQIQIKVIKITNKKQNIIKINDIYPWKKVDIKSIINNKKIKMYNNYTFFY